MTDTPDYQAPLPDLERGQESSVLLRLLNRSGARAVIQLPGEDFGLAESLPYPFLALVGQLEMRVALMLSIINPAIGGVLLIGPRGTGKTTAVRSLAGLLPDVEVSTCPDGDMPEDYARYGADGVCADCAEKLAKGLPITRREAVKLIELPLNARIEDVVGGVNERVAIQQNKIRLERGILSRADQNLLYIDEVNLLDDTIIDAILDAAAAGSYTVRRGAMVGTYRSRFVLIGSMNPEEGKLRPQLLDRFGLRIAVRGLMDAEERLDVYDRNSAFRRTPRQFMNDWASAMVEARDEIEAARQRLKTTTISLEARKLGIELVQKLDIDSHRADNTMFEAARAHAAADNRDCADVADVRMVAPMALRQRRSQFMVDFFNQQHAEDEEIRTHVDALLGKAEG